MSPHASYFFNLIIYTLFISEAHIQVGLSKAYSKKKKKYAQNQNLATVSINLPDK